MRQVIGDINSRLGPCSLSYRPPMRRPATSDITQCLTNPKSVGKTASSSAGVGTGPSQSSSKLFRKLKVGHSVTPTRDRRLTYPCMLIGLAMRAFSRACTRHTASRLHVNTPRPHIYRAKPTFPFPKLSLPSRRYSTPSNAHANAHHPSHGVAPSRLESKTHPLGWEVIQDQIDAYFSKHWDFGSEEDKRKFFALGLSRAFSQFFPLTLNERVEAVCKIHYLVLLIDGESWNRQMKRPC